MVYSPHWYDLYALFNKAFGDFTFNVQGLSQVRAPPNWSPRNYLNDGTNRDLSQGLHLRKAIYWGQSGARENHSLQIRNIIEAGYRSLKNERPVFLGECGIPMDMK